MVNHFKHLIDAIEDPFSG